MATLKIEFITAVHLLRIQLFSLSCPPFSLQDVEISLSLVSRLHYGPEFLLSCKSQALQTLQNQCSAPTLQPGRTEASGEV